jgi:hypothetical protein
MLIKENYMSQQIALRLRKVSLLTKAVVLGSVGMLPALLPATVGAAPSITSRTLSSTSAVPSQTTDLTWTFNTTADAGNANTIEIEFCDAPLGTCNTTNTPALSNTPTATLGGPWTTTAVTSTARDALSDGGGTDTQYTLTKTNNDDASAKTALTISFGATDITNNAAANKSYYTRVRIYDNNPTLKWEGVFAQSTSQTLTVNARVQERLDFCVASTAINNATSTPGTDCAAVTVAGTSSIDIGNIDSGAVNVSPVSATNGGSNTNAIAMIRTNAFNGASIAYRSLDDTSSGTLKVPGASCNATPSTSGTDQCFNTSATQGAWVLGTTGERFGMTIAGINCGSTSAYTCDFSTGATNLVRNSEYDGNGGNTYVADSDQVTSGTTTAGYAWEASPATTTTIATSTGSTVKVVDDEALVLKFAALSGITTPTGSYTVQADFIATTTF